MQHSIYILTGVIQTGKTTSLIKWCEEKENIQGILTPVIDSKRKFMDIDSKEMFAMEADENDIDVLQVGRFVFSAAAFEKAKQIIDESRTYNYLIIDEIGPLELRQEGLYAAIKKSLQQQTGHIVLVVREGLVEKVTAFFGLQNPSIIYKEELLLL